MVNSYKQISQINFPEINIV